ncbi:hypothetical protein JX266_012653 [Neoarthrinium moseri]|nr:hypothetical protein JX266_012653 [Neoarthrinium moseri]
MQIFNTNLRMLRLTWTNMIYETILTHRTFEGRFYKTMNLYRRKICSPFSTLESALADERALIISKIHTLMISKTKISIEHALLALLGHIGSPLGKGQDTSEYSTLLASFENGVLLIKALEMKGPSRLTQEDAQRYVQCCSELKDKLSSIYTEPHLRPLDPGFDELLPSPNFMMEAKTIEKKPRARDVLRRTPLHIQLYRNDTSKFPLYLGQGTLKTPDYFGRSLLHIASYNGDKGAVRSCLNHNYDATLQDKEGLTSLHCASGAGHSEVVGMLIDHESRRANAGLLLCREDTYQRTPLLIASFQGHTEAVKTLMSRSPDQSYMNRQDCRNWAALHYAVWRGHLGVVKELLSSRDVDVNLQNGEGRTPLHLAIIQLSDNNESWGILSSLREHVGTNPNVRDEKDRTPLHLALLCGNHSAAGSLLEMPSINTGGHDLEGNSVLHFAARLGYADLFATLLQTRPLSFNDMNTAMETPLHIAVRSKSRDIVKILLNIIGIQVNTTAVGGETPLMVAVSHTDRTTTGLLLQTGMVDAKLIRQSIERAQQMGSRHRLTMLEEELAEAGLGSMNSYFTQAR